MTTRRREERGWDVMESPRRPGELEAEGGGPLPGPEHSEKMCDTFTCASARELEALVHAVSHDLKAPLRAINGFSRILSEDHLEGMTPEVGELVGRLCEASGRLDRMLDGLLAYSRIGRCPVRVRSVETLDLVRRVWDDLCSETGERAMTFLTDDLPVCAADPRLMKLIFSNLLGNAIKFTKHKDVSVIEVRCREDAGEQVFAVRDNGAGFDMRYVHKLFCVFQRLHHQREYPGTGVGLALVRRAVFRMGGRVWAEADSLSGAVFSFALPKASIQPGRA